MLFISNVIAFKYSLWRYKKKKKNERWKKKICKIFHFIENCFGLLFIWVTMMGASHANVSIEKAEKKKNTNQYFKESPIKCTHMLEVYFAFIWLLLVLLLLLCHHKCDWDVWKMFLLRVQHAYLWIIATTMTCHKWNHEFSVVVYWPSSPSSDKQTS